MSVITGQAANAGTFNNAFVSKTANNTIEGNQTITGNVALNQSGSGGNISNAQQKINDAVSAAATAQAAAESAQSAADGKVSKSGDTITGNLGIEGNLSLIGPGRRISAGFSGSPEVDKCLFQTPTENATTVVGAIPNGTNQVSAWRAHNNSSPTNASIIEIRSGAESMALRSNALGTGEVLPLDLQTGTTTRMRVETDGTIIAYDDFQIEKQLLLKELESGTNPAAGYRALRAADDGIYVRDSAGNETKIGSGGEGVNHIAGGKGADGISAWNRFQDVKTVGGRPTQTNIDFNELSFLTANGIRAFQPWQYTVTGGAAVGGLTSGDWYYINDDRNVFTHPGGSPITLTSTGDGFPAEHKYTSAFWDGAGPFDVGPTPGTITLTSTNPLGTYANSFLFTPSSNAGGGIAIDFTIRRQDRSTLHLITLPYEIGGSGYSSGDVELWIKPMNGTSTDLIQPSSYQVVSTGGVGKFVATFPTTSDGTEYRLILLQKTTTSTYTLKFDDVTVSPTDQVDCKYTSSTTSVSGTDFSTVIHGTAVYDSMGIYNPSTGVMTASVAGLYNLQANAFFSSSASSVGARAYLRVFVNGTQIGIISTFMYQVTGTTVVAGMSGSTPVRLNVGDTLELKANKDADVSNFSFSGSSTGNWIAITRIGD